jgi:hypothetical protein
MIRTSKARREQAEASNHGKESSEERRRWFGGQFNP